MDLLWNRFEKSGSIEVYLKYKSREKNEFDTVNRGGVELDGFGEGNTAKAAQF